MRLLVFSDLHGNQYAWRAFLEQLSGEWYDRAVFLGDIFGYYYGQEEILRGLQAFPDLLWLKGNHERLFELLSRGEKTPEELTQRYGSGYLRCLNNSARLTDAIADKPFSRVLDADGKRILFCHGTPAEPAEGRLYPKDDWLPELCGGFDVVICGHTHFRMVREGGGRLWLNAGSLGQPRDGNHSGYLLFDTDTGAYEYRDVVYDKSALFREIEENDSSLAKLKEILMREKA